MPPMVAAAAVSGIAAITTSTIGAKSQSAATRRSTQAQKDAAAKAEAFEREQDEKDRADHARIEAEERRRWDVEQQNVAAQNAERDRQQAIAERRQAYEDKIRYRKMVNLAQLTGGPMPEAPPAFGGGADGTYAPSAYAPPGAPILSRPSTANAMIAPPGAFDPYTDAPQQGFPLNAVSRRRAV